MVNKTVLGLLLFTLFTFTLAESWDIYLYNSNTKECSEVDVGCHSCDANPAAVISYQVTCSDSNPTTEGFTNCQVQIFPNAVCSGVQIGLPIVDATFLDYDSACAYLEANTPSESCNIIGQPSGSSSSALIIILILVAVLVVIGIVVAVAVGGFIWYKKRNAASYATTF